MRLTLPRNPEFLTAFEGSQGQVHWHGFSLQSREQFREYLAGPVKRVLVDAENAEVFEAEMRALASTGMAGETLQQLLDSVPPKQAWEVGEALAGCFINAHYG